MRTIGFELFHVIIKIYLSLFIMTKLHDILRFEHRILRENNLSPDSEREFEEACFSHDIVTLLNHPQVDCAMLECFLNEELTQEKSISRLARKTAELHIQTTKFLHEVTYKAPQPNSSWSVEQKTSEKIRTVIEFAHGIGEIEDSLYCPDTFSFLDEKKKLQWGALSEEDNIEFLVRVQRRDFFELYFSGYTLNDTTSFLIAQKAAIVAYEDQSDAAYEILDWLIHARSLPPDTWHIMFYDMFEPDMPEKSREFLVDAFSFLHEENPETLNTLRENLKKPNHILKIYPMALTQQDMYGNNEHHTVFEDIYREVMFLRLSDTLPEKHETQQRMKI